MHELGLAMYTWYINNPAHEETIMQTPQTWISKDRYQNTPQKKASDELTAQHQSYGKPNKKRIKMAGGGFINGIPQMFPVMRNSNIIDE